MQTSLVAEVIKVQARAENSPVFPSQKDAKQWPLNGIKRGIIGTKEVQAIISTNAPEALWLLEEG